MWAICWTNHICIIINIIIIHILSVTKQFWEISHSCESFKKQSKSRPKQFYPPYWLGQAAGKWHFWLTCDYKIIHSYCYFCLPAPAPQLPSLSSKIIGCKWLCVNFPLCYKMEKIVGVMYLLFTQDGIQGTHLFLFGSWSSLSSIFWE